MIRRKVIRATGPYQLVEVVVAVRIRGGWLHEQFDYNPRQVTRQELARKIRAVRSSLRAVAFQVEDFETRYINTKKRNDDCYPRHVCR